MQVTIDSPSFIRAHLRDGSAGALYDMTNPSALGRAEVGNRVAIVRDILGRNDLQPGAIAPVASVQAGKLGIADDEEGSRVFSPEKPLIPAEPPFTIIFTHMSIATGLKAVLWQHKAGAPGRVQMVANGYYSGRGHIAADHCFQIFIGGATDGSGLGGQPRYANHPIGEPGVFVLVCRRESGASEFWRNGVLVDTFTCPETIVQTSTSLFSMPGFPSGKAGQFINRLFVIDKALESAEFELATNWAAAGLGMSWQNNSGGPYTPPSIAAESAICVQLPTADFREPVVLFEKNADKPLAPASLTKLLTCLTALRIADRFHVPITHHLEVTNDDKAGGSGNNLAPGEQFSFKDGLANLLLPSSNVTAAVFARIFGQMLLDRNGGGGDPFARFVQEMNAVAIELGAEASHFVNPHGISARRQVSTARDLLRITWACLAYTDIVDLWGHREYEMRIGGPSARTQKIATSVRMIANKDPGILGGKTGTFGSSYCNLSLYSAAPNGNRLVTISMGSPSDAERYADAQRILKAVEDGHEWTSHAAQPRL